ncbi:MAG: FtsQ-type POTRA domain-containing protein [Bacillota bacterium]|nr:FtsQ-type POTRA domain-containing protein [Bacillota bacterium]
MHRPRRSRRKNSRQDLRNFLKTLNIILFCAAGVFALYCFSQSPFFALQYLEVEGLKRLSLAEVKRESGLTEGSNLFQIDCAQARKRLLAHPLIEQVEVKRRMPRTVLIKLREREPRACLLVGNQFLILDRKGYCIDKITSLGPYSLPIITGLEPASTALGQQVSRNRALAVVLSALDEDVQSFFSEVNLAVPEQIIAYSREGIPILLGIHENLPEKLRLAVSFMGSLESDEAVEYVDLRAVQAPAVKYRENKAQEDKKFFR